MADYICSCRSNYVQLKPEKKDQFIKNAERAGFTVYDEAKGVMICKEDGSISDWYDYDEDGENIVGNENQPIIDWGKDFGSCLVDGEVLHLVESGYEKLRYLSGIVMFVRSDGKLYSMSINDLPTSVRKFAKKHGREITDATY